VVGIDARKAKQWSGIQEMKEPSSTRLWSNERVKKKPQDKTVGLGSISERVLEKMLEYGGLKTSG
jgi:hypothetical protein